MSTPEPNPGPYLVHVAKLTRNYTVLHAVETVPLYRNKTCCPFASERASFMTGEHVCVDGGYMALGAWAAATPVSY